MQKYLNKLVNRFWFIYKNHDKNFLLTAILSAASFFYYLAYKTRLILYKLNILQKKTLKAIVISVGNITTGGTGKTPITIELAKYFLNKGYKVAILSRGYKRKIYNKESQGTILVSDGEEILVDYEISGDEPYLIAKKVPKALVLVGKDKIKSGLSAIKLGAQVLIMDDGYQHLRLNRNENLLLLDCYKPFDNGHLLPRGNLRELPDSIKRATGIILTNSDKPLEQKDLAKINKFTDKKTLVKMNYKIKQIIALNIIKKLNISEAKGLKVIAFCGIGNPQSFIETLKKSELNILGSIFFDDHHHYNYDDIKQIIELAKKYNVENVITTEKDSIKIETLCEAAPATFWAAEIEVIWNIPNPFDLLLTNRDKWLK